MAILSKVNTRCVHRLLELGLAWCAGSIDNPRHGACWPPSTANLQPLFYRVYPVSLTVNLSEKIYLLSFIEHYSSGYSEITLYARGNDGWARIAGIFTIRWQTTQVSAMILDSSGNIQV